MSMYRQLWFSILISTLLALLGGMLASTLNAQAYLSQQLESKNSDNASALALALSRPSSDAVIVELTVASLYDSGHYELIRVTSPNGKNLVERVNLEPQYGVPSWFTKLLPIASTPGEADISSGWNQLGRLTLVSNRGVAYRSLWNSTVELLAALLASGLVGGYLGTRVLRQMRIPLERVINQAEAVSQRQFITIEEPKLPELRKLAVAMNGMVARLRGMFDEEANRLETMRSQANTDALTGLANQTFFLLQLLESLENEEKVGGTLLLVRIVDLTGINRQLGREETDQLLKAIAAILSKHAQSMGCLASRFKDADFGMLLPREADPSVLAKRLVVDLEDAGREAAVNDLQVAIGITQLQPEQDIASLMAEASRALISAATGGSSAVRESSSVDSIESPSNAQWQAQLEDALAQGRTRLVMQPVVALDGHLIHQDCVLELKLASDGAWHQAGRLKQITDQLHLTPVIALATLRLAVEHLRKSVKGPALAVGISANSLLDDRFRQQLIALLERHRAVAGRISIQLPEEDAVKHLTLFQEFCLQLKKTGSGAGLQHVGRQLGDISQLHHLGLDFLKVDSSYIRGLQYSPGNQAFLRGLCKIAHGIGTRVYAEGIVDPLEFAELLALGIDGASGPAVTEVREKS